MKGGYMRKGGEGLGFLRLPEQIGAITVPEVLRRAVEYGGKNFGGIYDATDRELFRGRLPGGYPEPRDFVDNMEYNDRFNPAAPGSTNMPGASPEIPRNDFVGPQRDAELRRRIEFEQLQRMQEGQKYSDPGYM